ncbi:MAG: hypothetical protein ACJ762_21525 [Solirubrobacteraceae bacterium]
MGFLKQMKDLKDTVNAAPGMVDQAMQLKAQAEQMQVAQQDAAQQAMQQAMAATAAPAAPAAAGDFAPIAGVSLELYAEVSRGLADYNYDQTKAVELAVAKGIAASDWQTAMDGWNARMTNQAVAQRFNALYTGRAV